MSSLWKEYHLSLQNVVDEPIGLFSTKDRYDLEKDICTDNFVEALLKDQNQNKYANECGTQKMKDRISEEILSLDSRLSTTLDNHFTNHSAIQYAAMKPLESLALREERLRRQLQDLEHQKKELLQQLSAFDEKSQVGSEVHLRHYQIKIKESQESSIPIRPFLKEISLPIYQRFLQRVQEERNRGDDDDYQDLLRNQISDWELILRRKFFGDHQNLIEPVLQKLPKMEKSILEEHFKEQRPHTLFVLELWIRGLRKITFENHPAMKIWLTQKLQKYVYMSKSNKVDVRGTLTRKKDNLAYFIQKLRKSRNLLAHGSEDSLTLPQYQQWCDFAYGTGTLFQWIDIGISPIIHPPQHFGWLTFLTFAFFHSDI